MASEFGAPVFGVGSPAGITPAAADRIYINTSNGSVWRSGSTTKGDWTKEPSNIGFALCLFDTVLGKPVFWDIANSKYVLADGTDA